MAGSERFDKSPLAEEPPARSPLPKTRRRCGGHAREAVKQYQLAALEPSVHILTRAYSALRALTLCNLTKMNAEVPKVLGVLKDLVLLDLSSSNRDTPGATLPLVAALATTRSDNFAKSDGGRELSEILESTLEKYGTPDHIDFISDIFQSADCVNESRRQEVRRTRVTIRLDSAERQKDSMMKLFRLEQAATEAKNLGYTDLHDRAVKELQRVDTKAINWTVIESNIEYPPHIGLAYVNQFVQHGSWKKGLAQMAGDRCAVRLLRGKREAGSSCPRRQRSATAVSADSNWHARYARTEGITRDRAR